MLSEIGQNSSHLGYRRLIRRVGSASVLRYSINKLCNLLPLAIDRQLRNIWP